MVNPARTIFNSSNLDLNPYSAEAIQRLTVLDEPSGCENATNGWRTRAKGQTQLVLPSVTRNSIASVWLNHLFLGARKNCKTPILPPHYLGRTGWLLDLGAGLVIVLKDLRECLPLFVDFDSLNPSFWDGNYLRINLCVQGSLSKGGAGGIETSIQMRFIMGLNLKLTRMGTAPCPYPKFLQPGPKAWHWH